MLDLLFVVSFDMGVSGAAWATVSAQMLAGIGIAVYTLSLIHIFKSGDVITLICEGEDEEEAMEAMIKAIDDGLGE